MKNVLAHSLSINQITPGGTFINQRCLPGEPGRPEFPLSPFSPTRAALPGSPFLPGPPSRPGRPVTTEPRDILHTDSHWLMYIAIKFGRKTNRGKRKLFSGWAAHPHSMWEPHVVTDPRNVVRALPGWSRSWNWSWSCSWSCSWNWSWSCSWSWSRVI